MAQGDAPGGRAAETAGGAATEGGGAAAGADSGRTERTGGDEAAEISDGAVAEDNGGGAVKAAGGGAVEAEGNGAAGADAGMAAEADAGGSARADGGGAANGGAADGHGGDAMLGFWSTWMQAVAGGAGPGGAALVAPPDASVRALEDGARRMAEQLERDPVLRVVDGMWNANPFRDVVPVDWAEISRALRTLWLHALRRPDGAAAATAALGARMWQVAFERWSEAGRRWLGEAPDGNAGGKADGKAGGKARGAGDKRFSDPEWQSNPFFGTLKDSYLLASDWLLRQGAESDLPPAERARLLFHLRQFVDASSPSLILAANPAALRRAAETGGASLAEGARNLAADLRAGRLSMVDPDAFAPGRNLATTPGSVVMRNRLVELIQYDPAPGTRPRAVPLLMLPPWINKFYVLDLQQKNSMVRFLREQGFTVFMLSWKNPDASMDDVSIEDYMRLGPLAASDAVRDITGSARVNVMGYCIGGTLLAMTLAWLAARGDDRFASATFMVSLQDFGRVGDTAVFMGDDAMAMMERQMLERGYLDSREMSNMFNLLRSNELIWANVVNNYLMGQKPPAFDLLHWNSDSTRMARAAHSWYLRNTYRENNLAQPCRIALMDERIDLGRIRQDIYAVGAERDHIVPWEGAWRITQLSGGAVRFVLASSGHIAGIINPPGGKGEHWVRDPSLPPAATAAEWRAGAERRAGSWWNDWASWLAERSGEPGAPPPMGSGRHPPTDPAPGRYVMEK